MGDWANLPSVVLTEIYGFLPDNDRAKMARVCRNWSSEFHNSRLWTHRRFRFGGFRCNTGEFSRALGYARMHGSALKSLIINCDHPSFVLCRKFQKTAGSFFGILTWKKAQVRGFQMRQMYTDRYWRQEYLRERLIASFCRFFRSQREVTSFDMTDATLPLSTGLRLLEALSRHCGATIQNLYLQDYFQARAPCFRNRLYYDIMRRFSALTDLHLSYSCVCDELLETLGKNCSQLQQLSVRASRTEPHVHTVDSSSWLRLKRACSSLAVCMDFEGIGKYEDLRRILLRDVPLHSLHIWTGAHHLDETIWRLDDTLRYIGQAYENTLEDAWLAIETGREIIDGGLLDMLRRCRRLESLDVQACLSVSTIETICQLQDEYKIDLLVCHIIIDSLSGQQADQLEEITNRYLPMIEERCLDFYFHYHEMPLL